MKHPVSLSRQAVAIAVFSILLPASLSAREDDSYSGYSMAVMGEPSNRVDLEFGYFTCRRQTFRKIYGSYLDYGLNFSHRINSRLAWELRTEFIRLHGNGSSLRYWSLSETPTVIYALSGRTTLVPIVGAGIGLTFRKVIAEFDSYAATQRELSAVVVAMGGADLHLSRTLVLGSRVYFDYHPFGDPSTGDFGDTGGYHFTFRLGRKF